LAAVTSAVMENRSDQNTMINSGSETGIIHNRIADKLPAEAPTTPTDNSPPTTSTARLSKFRPPRKPR
jgi:hypothetical protein